MKQTGIGGIGCGMISGIYLKNLTQVFQNTRVVACAALHLRRAEERAEEFGVPRACSVDELLSDPEVETVLNLTVPSAHASVSLAALESGRLSAYGADVVHDEWRSNMLQSELIQYSLSHDNVVITPHIGGCTFKSLTDARFFSARKLVHFLKTGEELTME